MADSTPQLAVNLRSEQLSRELIRRYAHASGDLNPIHVDAAAAQDAGFQDVIAHGMLTMATVARLVTSRVGPPDIRRLSVRFVAPVPVGETVLCSGVEAGTVEIDGDTYARIELVANLADGNVVVRGEALVEAESWTSATRPN